MLKTPILAATVGILAIISPLTYASDTPTTPQQQRQLRAQNMMQYYNCLQEKIDAPAFEKMSQDSETLDNNLFQLCSNGQRQQAQALALDYAKKMLASDNFKAMLACTAQFEPNTPGIPDLEKDFDLEQLKQGNICDLQEGLDQD